MPFFMLEPKTMKRLEYLQESPFHIHQLRLVSPMSSAMRELRTLQLFPSQ
jgi:hypothetical protein